MAIFHFNDIVSFNCAFHCSSDEKGVSDKDLSQTHQMFSAGGKGGGRWMGTRLSGMYMCDD